MRRFTIDGAAKFAAAIGVLGGTCGGATTKAVARMHAANIVLLTQKIACAPGVRSTALRSPEDALLSGAALRDRFRIRKRAPGSATLLRSPDGRAPESGALPKIRKDFQIKYF